MKMLLKRELLEAKIVALEARASRRWSRSAKGCAAVLGGFAQGIGRGLSLRTFDTVEEFRQALLAFREVYKNTWLLDGTGSRRPPPCASASFPPRHSPRRVHTGVSQSEGGTRVSNPFGGFAPLSKATLGARSAGRLWPVPCGAACCPVTLRSDAR
jgi:hypothetical protein